MEFPFKFPFEFDKYPSHPLFKGGGRTVSGLPSGSNAESVKLWEHPLWRKRRIKRGY